MKTPKNIFLIFLVFGIYICGNISAQKNGTPNEIINKYDPILSSIQYYYRTWTEEENRTFYSEENFLVTSRIKDLSYINNSIKHLRNSIDTVKTYLKDLAYVSAEYGDKLKSRIKDSNVQMEFQSKWREYQEGVTIVMAYDIQRITQFLNVYYFLRDNQSEFEVEKDMVYFYDEAPLNKYNKLLILSADSKLTTDQEVVRIKVMRSFSEALNLVKGNEK